MKTLTELVEELVDVKHELEKAKYSRPERLYGWVASAIALAHGLDSGLGKRQLANHLQKLIDEVNQELSDLSAKVEA